MGKYRPAYGVPQHLSAFHTRTYLFYCYLRTRARFCFMGTEVNSPGSEQGPNLDPKKKKKFPAGSGRGSAAGKKIPGGGRAPKRTPHRPDRPRFSLCTTYGVRGGGGCMSVEEEVRQFAVPS